MKKTLITEKQDSEFIKVYTACEDYLYLINVSEYTRKAYLSNFRNYYQCIRKEKIEDTI